MGRPTITRRSDTYNVHQGNDVTTIEGRTDAVSRAKELSSRGSTVRVESLDGRIRMVFQGGSLLTYVSDSGAR